MAQNTMISGTVYEITGGKTMANGTVYEITGGKTMVSGTVYGIGLPSVQEMLNETEQGETV